MNYREILRNHKNGLTKREIASSCCCSRNTVASVLKKAESAGIDYAKAKDMSDEQLQECLFGKRKKENYKMPDFDEIFLKMQESNVTITELWREYKEECTAENKDYYGLTRFKELYKKFIDERQNNSLFKAGEVMFVSILDDICEIEYLQTGKSVKVGVFCAILPYSGYTYIQPVIPLNTDTWLMCHTNAFSMFGGTGRKIMCYDVRDIVSVKQIAEEYRELSEKNDIAVIPVNSRKSMKRTMNINMEIVKEYIVKKVKDKKFGSVKELERFIKTVCTEFNHNSNYNNIRSRKKLFDDVEKNFIKSSQTAKVKAANIFFKLVDENGIVEIEDKKYLFDDMYNNEVITVYKKTAVIEFYCDNERITAVNEIAPES